MIAIQYLFEKTIPELKRTLSNKPKGKNPREWMKISRPIKLIQKHPEAKNFGGTWGQSAINNKYYGWSHRAIASFAVGDKVSKDTCGNIRPGEQWVIKTELEAAKQASEFAKDVS